MLHIRLKEELERLGLKPVAAAKAIGEPDSQGLRDVLGGRKRLSAELLAALAGTGVDVAYVLTNQRQGHGIGESAVHQAVLDAVDLLSLEKKVDAVQLAKAVVKLVTKSAPSTESSASVQVAGDFNGQMVEGDAINTGTMNFGGKHRHKKS
ncbi:hypothetical protein NK214_06090 [Chromobacterium sp. S0633]|uniref:hypothetical protein n=1 Tax=Chromobacterium sp. S0633 TaxID=2957805 RepID=UPI00209FCCE0|nr:hypothetical protein [Chromobacterium sp. S0633]MCP1289757.1 hypothetical protein [Chromobacterium sp. S0633]